MTNKSQNITHREKKRTPTEKKILLYVNVRELLIATKSNIK